MDTLRAVTHFGLPYVCRVDNVSFLLSNIQQLAGLHEHGYSGRGDSLDEVHVMLRESPHAQRQCTLALDRRIRISLGACFVLTPRVYFLQKSRMSEYVGTQGFTFIV